MYYKHYWNINKKKRYLRFCGQDRLKNIKISEKLKQRILRIENILGRVFIGQYDYTKISCISASLLERITSLFPKSHSNLFSLLQNFLHVIEP